MGIFCWRGSVPCFLPRYCPVKEETAELFSQGPVLKNKKPVILENWKESLALTSHKRMIIIFILLLRYPGQTPEKIRSAIAANQ